MSKESVANLLERCAEEILREVVESIEQFRGQVRISVNVTARFGDRDRRAHRSGAGVDYSDRAVTISQIGVGLSHGFSSQWQAV